MNQETLFKERLRSNGERLTSPRLITFRALLRKTPLTTTKLVELLKENGIDAATTYRNLLLFRSMGIIQDVVAGGQRLIELSEDFGSHHHHFWCMRCGKLQDFDNPEIDQAIDQLSERLRIQVKSHQLELSGVCTDCIAKH